MCGIAGLLFSDPERSVDRDQLACMAGAIAHRGPDADGFWAESGVGLAHRRLSIIDLAGGDQPIGNEDGSIQVVFNGEIYNYRELKRDLESNGHTFRTNSDTEVLVHLYEERGSELVSRLRGMFAFALWDRPRRRLLLARDRLGIKPLYIYRDAEKLLFGSELKAILAYPGVPRHVDPAALEDYLAYGMVPGARTIFERIEKLPPAHVLELGPDRLNAPPRRYWQLRIEPDERLSPADWCEQIRAKLAEAIRLHLIADVPVGAFLSGGIDSSVIVALAAQELEEPIRTFSIGFEEAPFSELPAARLVSQQYGTRHVEEIVRPDAVSLLGELAHYYDEPFADPSAVPTYLVSRLAAQHVKVVLSGDGGDEAFGGYARYAHDLREGALRNHLPAWFRHAALGPLSHVWPKADWLPRPLRAKTTLRNLSLDPDAAYANTLSLCRQPLRRRLLHPDLARGLNGHDPGSLVRESFAMARQGDLLGGMVAADVGMLLPDDFLVKVDRASMAWGLEVRPPLLDHELFELAARIPSGWKIHSSETKWIFKEAFASVLPAGIRSRPKQGFEMPIDAWLRGPLDELFQEAVLGSDSTLAGLIDVSQVGRLHAAHRAGTGRFGSILWSLLILARWSARYLEAPQPATASQPSRS